MMRLCDERGVRFIGGTMSAVRLLTRPIAVAAMAIAAGIAGRRITSLGNPYLVYRVLR